MKGRIGLLSVLLGALLLASCRRAPQVRVTPPPAPESGTEHWWNERVFYEVFVRSFQDSDGDGIGDLEGLISRLDYLNDGDPAGGEDLGVTGLWLMPIMESPSYHGYDVVDYRVVEKDYGDNETFKRLIDEAHARGMVVIIDLVINHTSSQHSWFLDPARRDWYVWSDEDPGYAGPWGQDVWYPRGEDFYYAIFWEGMPDLNYRQPAVTDEIYDVTRFWLQDMDADGFRMDAIRHLIEDGAQQENTPETHAWLQAWHDYYKSVDPQAMAVGEVWTRTEDVVPYVGDELDLCFEFDLAGAILSSARGGSAALVESAAQKADDSFPAQQYATFLTNHDHERAMTQLGEDERRARTAAAIYLTLPGVPFMYYGEEIGMIGRKPDENLRTPMQWSAEAGAGFTSAALPWYPINRDYETRNVSEQLAREDSLLAHYRRLIRLRGAFSALRSGDLVTMLSSDRRVYAYLRHGDGQDVLVVHNLSAEEVPGYQLSLRAGPLSAGEYRAYDLLGEAWVTSLTIQANGVVTAYAPLAGLPAGSSLVLLLDR